MKQSTTTLPTVEAPKPEEKKTWGDWKNTDIGVRPLDAPSTVERTDDDLLLWV